MCGHPGVRHGPSRELGGSFPSSAAPYVYGPATQCIFMGLTCWKMFLKCSHRIYTRGSMIREHDNARRRAFIVWVRTGRLPHPRDANEIEFKFNPWHDPENGRFTFAGTGRYYARGDGGRKDHVARGRARVEYGDDPAKPPIGSMEEADAWRAAELAKHGRDREYREAIEARYLVYKRAFVNERRSTAAPSSVPNPGPDRESTASQSMPLSSRPVARADSQHLLTHDASRVRRMDRGGEPPVPSTPALTARGRSAAARNGGGDFFGGGGATGSWEASESPRARRDQEGGVRDAASVSLERRSSESGREGGAPVGSERWRKVERNGYLYEIDEQNRTRRVSGEITLNPEQGRSPAAQRAAGGGDRRDTDHGGHYIARRFNGPTEAFNHFAQDASFNRRDYAKLENQWERAKRQGKQVRVKIIPVYEGRSQRPSALNVWFYIDGKEGSYQLPNEPKGRRDAEHRD